MADAMLTDAELVEAVVAMARAEVVKQGRDPGDMSIDRDMLAVMLPALRAVEAATLARCQARTAEVEAERDRLRAEVRLLKAGEDLGIQHSGTLVKLRERDLAELAGLRAEVQALRLPSDLLGYMARHLSNERRGLDGFVALGNERGRAACYDAWIAAIDAAREADRG